MSIPVYKYRVWCNTGSKWEYVWRDGDQGEPTVCPSNPAHAIDTAKTAVVDKVEEATITVKEENTPTGGNYQSSFYEINVPSGVGETTADVSFPHPVSMLSAEWTNFLDLAGDEIRFEVAPNTIVGATVSGVASGVKVLPVQQSVIDNMKIGYCVELYSASGVNKLGRCVDKNNNDNTITTELSTIQSFSPLWPTYVRMCIDLVRKSPLAGFGRIQLGDSKIGGSYIPTNTILRATYYNNNGLAKKLIFVLEYLY